MQNFKAGVYKKCFHGKDYEYQYFSPESINKPFEWKDKRITLLLEEAVRLLGKFLKADIVKEITGHSRNRLFVLWKYLDLFKK